MSGKILLWAFGGLCLIAVCALLLRTDSEPPSQPGENMKLKRVEITIDDATIAKGDPQEVIEPVWDQVDIYGSLADYERTLKRFSERQRHVLAVLWYRAEVNNGGHDQFFSNSTGIVWPDAEGGFDAIGVPEGAAIIRTASDRIGGADRKRAARQEQLDVRTVEFEDLDDRFYKLDSSDMLDRQLMKYIREAPSDFYFHGTVERPIWPGPE